MMEGQSSVFKLKKYEFPKPRRLTFFVNLRGKYYLWGQIHILATSVWTRFPCVWLTPVWVWPGIARHWGRQEPLGKGGNSLCFTDMNIQNLNSSVPACLFPQLSNWLRWALSWGAAVQSLSSSEQGWVWGARLLNAKSPGSRWARDVFCQISGARGTAVPKPPLRSSLNCSPLHSHRWSLLAAQ